MTSTWRTTSLLLLCLMIGACALLRTARLPAPSPDQAFYDTYSKKFGIRFSGTENRKLILVIDQWLGAPYRLGGCSKSGVDCSCLVQAVFKEVYGISLPRSSHEMYQYVQKIKKHDLREADLVFLKGPDKKISHVGIYLKDSFFVHVTTAQGVKISSLNEPCYKKSFYAAGRVQGTG